MNTNGGSTGSVPALNEHNRPHIRLLGSADSDDSKWRLTAFWAQKNNSKLLNVTCMAIAKSRGLFPCGRGGQNGWTHPDHDMWTMFEGTHLVEPKDISSGATAEQRLVPPTLY